MYTKIPPTSPIPDYLKLYKETKEAYNKARYKRYRVYAGFIDQVIDTLEEKGMLLKDLADLLGMHKEDIDTLVRNPTLITLELMFKITEVLDIRLTIFPYNNHKALDPTVFKECWAICDEPQNGWDLKELREKRKK